MKLDNISNTESTKQKNKSKSRAHQKKLQKMNKIHLLCLLFFCIYHVDGQNSNDIIVGKIDSIESKILGEQRKIWIHVPDTYTDDIYAKTSYPVVYLLDGDAHFVSVVGMLQQLSSINGNSMCPKMIVVGIPNTNRTRDLTPTQGPINFPYVDSLMSANSGGGDQFMSFIENELMPKIESEYPTQPYRMLIGHSLGGLMVVNTLLHKPELFNSYISIDPSMWWDNGKLLEQVRNTSLDEKYDGKKLFLGIAHTMSEAMDTATAVRDTTQQTEHIRSILELHALLDQDTKKQLTYKGKYYRDDSHGSVPFITEYDALRYIFKFYELRLEEQDFFDPESAILSKVENHYKKLSKEFGVPLKPGEAYVNGLGYQFLSMQQNEKAEKFFKLNVSNYPESFNVFDSMGDYYVATGNKEKAIENFEKSILLNKNSFSLEKLLELQKK